MSVGLARAAMDAAVQYAKERITFGTPIGHHQAIQLLLADMAKTSKPARLLTCSAPGSSTRGIERRRVVLGEMFCHRYRHACDHRCGAGLRRLRLYEGPALEKYMRDAKLMQIYGAPIKSNACHRPHLLGLA